MVKGAPDFKEGDFVRIWDFRYGGIYEIPMMFSGKVARIVKIYKCQCCCKLDISDLIQFSLSWVAPTNNPNLTIVWE